MGGVYGAERQYSSIVIESLKAIEGVKRILQEVLK
jgi:hypothetical protein